MKLIRVSKVILSWKHVLPYKTFKCKHCKSFLDVVAVTNNPNHYFNPGQEFSCSCGKSKLWGNSVRRMQSLKDYCDGKDVVYSYNPESYGFCDDKFCPNCWDFIRCLSNGYKQLDGKDILDKELWEICDGDREKVIQLYHDGKVEYVDSSSDVYGCESCDNKWLLDQRVGGGEFDGQKAIAIWYRENQHLWRDDLPKDFVFPKDHIDKSYLQKMIKDLGL